MIRIVAFILALAGLASGLYAAQVWLKSAKVAVAAPYPENGIPPGPEVEMVGWTISLLEAVSSAAALNVRAAKWTAASVLLNGAAAVLGAWPF